MLAPGIGKCRRPVIAYLDHIGRVEGKITRIIEQRLCHERRRDAPANGTSWRRS